MVKKIRIKSGFREVRVETNSTVTKLDEAKHQSIPIELHTLLQTIIESSYFARDHQKVYSKFEYANSRIEELERELDISRVDFEKSNYLATEAVEKLEKMIEGDKSRDLEHAHAKSWIQELETKLEASDAKRTELENINNLTNDAMKNFDKMVENIKSDSDRSREKIVEYATEADRVLKKGLEDLNSKLERCRDQIAKDAIHAFKFSDEFLNASTYNMDAFVLNFLNFPTDDATNHLGQSIKSAQSPEKRYKAAFCYFLRPYVSFPLTWGCCF